MFRYILGFFALIYYGNCRVNIEDVNMIGVLIPRELVSRQHEYIVRYLDFEGLQIRPDSTSFAVTLHNRANGFYKELFDISHLRVENCSDMYSHIRPYEYAYRHGSQCGFNGILIWYKISLVFLQLYDEFYVWTDVIIEGLKYGEFSQPTTITYPLDPVGQVDLLNPRGGEASITYDNDYGMGTTICFRYSDRGCGHKNPTCDNLQKDVFNECGEFKKCVRSDHATYECGECILGFKSVSDQCIDIDECLENTHNCNFPDICTNTYGSFWCRVAEESTPSGACKPGFIKSSFNHTSTCIKYEAIAPPEIVCNVENVILRALLAPNSWPNETPFLNLTGTIVLKDGSNRQSMTYSIRCQAGQADSIHYILDSDLISPRRPYTMSYIKPASVSTRYKIKTLATMLSSTGVKCFSNSIIIWYPTNVWVENVQISGNIVTGIGRTHSSSIHTITYAPNDVRVPVESNKCVRIDTSDNCQWVSSNTSSISENSVCDLASDGSFCDEKQPGVFGCSCTAPGTDCVSNTLCYDGFYYINGTCVDIDECIDEPCSVNQTCINSYGTFQCVDHCPLGYYLNNFTRECQDFDECLVENHECDPLTTNCINLPGGYRCSCKSPNTQELDFTRKRCAPIAYEYRLLDPNRVRCCGHTPDLTTFLVKCRVNTHYQNILEYSSIEPVACLHLTRIDPTTWDHAAAKLYLITNDAKLEEESLLQYVRHVNDQINRKLNKTSISFQTVFMYPGGCRQTFVTDSYGPATSTVFVMKTNPTPTFYNPMHTLTRKCKHLGLNPEFLGRLLLQPKPDSMNRTTLCRNHSTKSTQPLAILIIITLTILYGLWCE